MNEAYQDEFGAIICGGCALLYPNESDEDGAGWSGLAPLALTRRVRCSVCGIVLVPQESV